MCIFRIHVFTSKFSLILRIKIRVSQMEVLSACRACLATDAKLYNMFKYGLVSAYENLTGVQLSEMDGQPCHICSYCAALLRKSASFKQKCRNAQQLLTSAIVEQHQITMEYIHSIDRQVHNLTLPFTIVHNSVTIKQELTLELTSLLSNIIEQSDVKVEESDDEEPLVKFVKKRKNNHNVEAPQELLPELTRETKPPIVKTESNDLSLDYGDYNEAINDDQYDDDEADEKPDTGDDEIEVVVLSKEEQMQELQERKNSLNYKNSFYKCDMCFKGFMLERTYGAHMQRHHPSFGPYPCDICQLRFPDKKTLGQHTHTTHSRNYHCRICALVTKSKNRARQHYKWHQGVLYICDICGAAFDKQTSRLTHIRLHHPSRHICTLCGASFVSAHGLAMHSRKAHRQNTEVQEPNPVHKCVFCEVQFSNEAALEKHISLSNNEICDPTLWPCIFCGESFPVEDMLKKHAAQHQGEEKTYECIECNKTFSNARAHALHYRRVHARIMNKPSKDYIKSNAVCEICGKKCTSKATLVYHQRTHSGEKPYQCTECPKRFSVQQRLQIHIRTHTGERPCQCPHCPKAFKHKAALNRHLRVHTGVKPYSCPHCGKSFSQSNSMKGHVRSVHLKLPALYRRAGKRGEYSE